MKKLQYNSPVILTFFLLSLGVLLLDYICRQRTAQGKSSIAHKGTLYAAKVMAASAIDLLQDPDLLRAAREEHRAQLAGRQYLPIPPEARPVAVRGAQSES